MTGLPTYALIVAGGQGQRMGSVIAKQFHSIGGMPVLMHTLRAFFLAIPSLRIILVLPAGQVSYWQSLCEQHRFTVPHQIVTGGKERFHSVRNGLDQIPDGSIVAIHDGVRPLVSKDLIIKVFSEAEQFGHAVPAVSLNESARIIEEEGALAFPRERIRIIQTPQAFHSTLIREAYRQPYQPEFTDDATVLEAAGHIIHLTEGESLNIKITRPEDLIVAEVLLKMAEKA